MILEMCSFSRLSNFLADNCRILLWFFLYLWCWLLFHLLFLFYLGTLTFFPWAWLRFITFAYLKKKKKQHCVSSVLPGFVSILSTSYPIIIIFFLLLTLGFVCSCIFRSPNHSNQTRKRGRRYPDWRGRNERVTACRWHDTIYRKP